MQAVVLAGGKGTRLKPYTNILPKPLMPLGDLSILEILLMQLKQSGVTEVILSCGYLNHIIRAIFENKEKNGVLIKYSIEEKPLGTAGPLSLVIEDLKENFLVLNGDVLTNLNFKKLYQFHVSTKAAATICIKRREVKIDFGVIESDNDKFLNYKEKPQYNFDVSMGVNVFNKNMIKKYIKSKDYLDIPDLINLLKKNNLPIKCFRDDCEWLDIGRIDDYERAIDIFEKNKRSFLKEN